MLVCAQSGRGRGASEPAQLIFFGRAKAGARGPATGGQGRGACSARADDGKVCTPKKVDLVAEARKAWREAHAAKGGRLWMKHVKGHSGDRWNDRADGLADEGRRGTRRSGADSAFGWA